jgi:release factor glutamine methyltransferase
VVVDEALAKLKAGQPLPYVLGTWEFFGLQFNVTPATLIPRPETELLVEQAVRWLSQRTGDILAADVGTGSGCIAVSLAVHVPSLRLIASDISMPALQVALLNAKAHTVGERLLFCQADLLPTIARPFDLVCANLPYIPSDQLPQLDVFAREPASALDGGPQGLDHIARLLGEAHKSIAQSSLLLLEIEASQGEAALRLAETSFPSAKASIHPDLTGRDRLLRIETQP